MITRTLSDAMMDVQGTKLLDGVRLSLKCMYPLLFELEAAVPEASDKTERRLGLANIRVAYVQQVVFAACTNYGGGCGNTGAKGTKNPRQRPGISKRSASTNNKMTG